jgi:hypothetical protein
LLDSAHADAGERTLDPVAPLPVAAHSVVLLHDTDEGAPAPAAQS